MFDISARPYVPENVITMAIPFGAVSDHCGIYGRKLSDYGIVGYGEETYL
jgi:hypothetical protein